MSGNSPSARRSRNRRRVARVIVLKKVAKGEGCWLCGGRMFSPAQNDPDELTADHLVRWRDGGQETWENIRPAHRRCNRERS